MVLKDAECLQGCGLIQADGVIRRTQTVYHGVFRRGELLEEPSLNVNKH